MPRQTDPLLTLPDKSGVLYVRLYQRMRALIMQGAWPPGMRLPSSRRIAEDLGISRNTASLALDQLLADGWIETRSRAGTFVGSELPFLAAAVDPQVAVDSRPPGRPPVPFELNHNAVDAFPFDRWARLQAKVWSNFVPDLLYEGHPAGDPGLRQAIAGVVAPMRGATVNADDVIIIGGTMSGFDLIASTLPDAATIIVEDPGYHFGDAVFRQRGCTIVPAAVDDQGMDVAAARRSTPSPDLIVLSSASQFPRGVPLSAARRRELLDWAAACGAWIIDDEFEADARFDDHPPAPSLRAEAGGDRVITVCSLSRMLFRSLRLGYMLVPGSLRAEILAARAAHDSFEPLPNQLVLREFIDRGLWSAHQRRCRELYRERREALVATLAPYLGTLFENQLNPCGLHLLLRPRGHASADIAGALRQAGIACVTVSQLARQDPAAEGILLGFAAFSPDVIEAVRPALDTALRPFAAD
ncbi:MAG TPA: PLP-dependent aminotransferase family protein [Sphingomicrobium sp.]